MSADAESTENPRYSFGQQRGAPRAPRREATKTVRRLIASLYGDPMTAEQYRDYLDSFAPEFSSATLHPAQSTQIFNIEDVLGASLPEQYETFLTTVGTGDDGAVLGRWFHLDVMTPGNVMEVSAHIPEGSLASGMLVIYDANDGDVYGFLPDSQGHYLPEVYAWNSADAEFRSV